MEVCECVDSVGMGGVVGWGGGSSVVSHRNLTANGAHLDPLAPSPGRKGPTHTINTHTHKI